MLCHYDYMRMHLCTCACVCMFLERTLTAILGSASPGRLVPASSRASPTPSRAKPAISLHVTTRCRAGPNSWCNARVRDGNPRAEVASVPVRGAGCVAPARTRRFSRAIRSPRARAVRARSAARARHTSRPASCSRQRHRAADAPGLPADSNSSLASPPPTPAHPALAFPCGFSRPAPRAPDTSTRFRHSHLHSACTAAAQDLRDMAVSMSDLTKACQRPARPHSPYPMAHLLDDTRHAPPAFQIRWPSLPAGGGTLVAQRGPGAQIPILTASPCTVLLLAPLLRSSRGRSPRGTSLDAAHSTPSPPPRDAPTHIRSPLRPSPRAFSLHQPQRRAAASRACRATRVTARSRQGTICSR